MAPGGLSADDRRDRSAPLLRVQRDVEDVPGPEGPRRRVAGGPLRRDRRGAGPQRVGQVDAGQDPGRRPPGRPGAIVEVRGAEGQLVSGPAARDELHFIHQDLGLADILTTVENLGLGRPHRGRAFAPVRGAAERRHARAADRPVRRRLRRRPSPWAGCRRRNGRSWRSPGRMDGWTRPDNVLVLDEPTTALHGDEVQVLFEAVRRVAASGAGVVFISHRLDEVLELADRVVVLRDGRVVAEEPTDRLDHDAIVTLIAGREVADVSVDRATTAGRAGADGQPASAAKRSATSP